MIFENTCICSTSCHLFYTIQCFFTTLSIFLGKWLVALISWVKYTPMMVISHQLNGSDNLNASNAMKTKNIPGMKEVYLKLKEILFREWIPQSVWRIKRVFSIYRKKYSIELSIKYHSWIVKWRSTCLDFQMIYICRIHNNIN